MADWILAGVLLLIVGAAVLQIRKARKKGVKCIGCPSGGCCSGNGSSPNCGCKAAAGENGNGCSGCGNRSHS